MAAIISNLSNIIYIAFRLAPFLLVSFFTMSSIFNYDYKGIIYLCGLLLTTVIAFIVGKFNVFTNTTGGNTPEDIGKNLLVCNSLTLSDSGPLSNIPLSILVSAYTFAYLLYFIYLANTWVHNIATYCIFVTLIFCQMYWARANMCSTAVAISAALAIGFFGGALWGLLVNNIGISHLGFFNGLGNQNVCSIPKKQTFKCTKRNLP
jgi:hypothetical protein